MSKLYIIKTSKIKLTILRFNKITIPLHIRIFKTTKYSHFLFQINYDKRKITRCEETTFVLLVFSNLSGGGLQLKQKFYSFYWACYCLSNGCANSSHHHVSSETVHAWMQRLLIDWRRHWCLVRPIQYVFLTGN